MPNAKNNHSSRWLLVVIYSLKIFQMLCPFSPLPCKKLHSLLYNYASSSIFLLQLRHSNLRGNGQDSSVSVGRRCIAGLLLNASSSDALGTWFEPCYRFLPKESSLPWCHEASSEQGAGALLTLMNFRKGARNQKCLSVG